ncbi:MAG: EAL domain-containing protein [Acidimicrobiia bacterium]
MKTRGRTQELSVGSATRLLLVEDNLGDARLLQEMLKEPDSPDFELTHVESMSEAVAWLGENTADIILLDLGLPDGQGLDVVRQVRRAAPHVPLVVLTDRDDEELADQSLQAGAEDYLLKGEIEPRALIRSLRYAVERKLMQEALSVEKDRVEVVTLNSLGEGVISLDVSGIITFVNLEAERMTGWSRAEASGQPFTEVFQGVDATTREAIQDPSEWDSVDDQTTRLLTNGLLISRDSPELPFEASVSPLYGREGQATGSVIVFRDVSAARAMALEMTHSFEHDFLTGLPNRILLNDRIDQAIALAPRHHSQVAVLFLDLDGFKHINDSLGHSVGDKLLQSIAERLLGCVRQSDTVSRQGGDEFVVLLSDTDDGESAAIVANRMLIAVAEAHSIESHDLHVSTSIGISVYPDDGSDAETLIKNADTAMYQAKASGRQRYQFFKQAMNVRAVERQSIEESLRHALEREEFVLHYQPKVNLRTGQITGAEALIRWVHPSRGMVSPAQFIPIAEESGLIRPIGDWVIEEACRQAQAWVASGLPPTVMAVNVSAAELGDETYVQRLGATLGRTGIDPRRLELELTESVLMKHAHSAAILVQDLRRLGVKVALDDFGTGYSSLSYLRDFPIDTLKIDQSFVSEVTSAGSDTRIVAAVIGLARSLGLKVVAEGVETREQLEFLRARECDEAQGYYFSRPMPADEFAEMLRAGTGFDVDPGHWPRTLPELTAAPGQSNPLPL